MTCSHDNILNLNSKIKLLICKMSVKCSFAINQTLSGGGGGGRGGGRAQKQQVKYFGHKQVRF